MQHTLYCMLVLLVKRHSGVLGLAALIEACPYSVPAWLPEVVDELASHLNDPAPIQVNQHNHLSDSHTKFSHTHCHSYQPYLYFGICCYSGCWHLCNYKDSNALKPQLLIVYTRAHACTLCTQWVSKRELPFASNSAQVMLSITGESR